jgi:hypothetical protein
LSELPERGMVDRSVPYILGQLESKLEAIEENAERSAEEQRIIRNDIKEIKQTLYFARGGWKVLVAVGTTIAAVVGLLAGFWDKLFGG